MVFKYDLAFIALFVCVLNVVNGGLENSTISSSSSSSSFSSSSSSSSSSTSTEPRSVSCDYKYEIFNPKTDKCECKEGFSGWGCQMCDSNLACQGIDKNYQCVNGLIYKKHSDHKTYACELDPSIQSLLSDGALAVKCDRTTGNCSVAIFKKKETVVGEHIIDCSLTTCKFEDDSSDGSCGLIECKCGKSCSTLTKQIVEKSLSGKPVKITAQNNTLNIEIQDFLTPLAAICKASACEISDSSGSGSSSGGSHGWSKGLLIAVITCAATAGIVLVCVLGCSCFVSTRILHDQKDVEDPRPLSSMPGRVLEFNQLSCRAYVKEGKNKPSREKLILQNINGKVTRGSVLGLLGPSGSGKTSLLNALAAVENGKSTFTGEILIDQQRISRDYRKIASYVQQDDSLYSTLTVRECIQYSAQLRLPSTMSQAAKEVMVDRVIDELNLTHVTNSRIGSSGTARGISGGERRRVSIGMELVTSPMVIFFFYLV
jgi:ABC-type lipoprotein export system ATPase subunit